MCYNISTVHDDSNYDYDDLPIIPKNEGVKEENNEEMDMDGSYEAIEESDYWTVIDSFFADKGLVRQQLESYNEFIENTMQEIVDERARLTLDQHAQYSGNAGDETVSLERGHRC
jgi:DNA-directed RNA polymerase II subunit RPB2